MGEGQIQQMARNGATDLLAQQLTYLDGLRASGQTNIFGARPWLAARFCISRDEAGEILSAWMRLDLDIPAVERAKTIIEQRKIKP